MEDRNWCKEQLIDLLESWVSSLVFYFEMKNILFYIKIFNIKIFNIKKFAYFVRKRTVIFQAI